MSSHYDTLGVAKDASAQEVRKAYLRRARALHPDRQQGRSAADARRAAEAMQQVNVAWNVLSDSKKRSEYDRQFGSQGPARQVNQNRPTPARPSAPTARTASTAQRRPASGGTSRGHGSSIDDEPGDGSVSVWASLPVLIIVGIVLGILLVTAFGGSDGDSNRPVVPELDSQMRDDDCFRFVADSIQVESCSSGRADAQVIDLVPDPGNCPANTENRREGDLVLCFRRLVPGSTVTVLPE